MAIPLDLDVIIGKRPWKASKGIGSFLFLEFGRKKRDADGAPRGEYSLWIYMADWLLDQNGREIAHSESSDSVISKAAVRLTGKRLDAITLMCEIGKGKALHAVSFAFESGFSLHASMYDDCDPSEIFMLFTPMGNISYRYDGTLAEQGRVPNQSSDPTFALGTPRAGHESRHR
jgi:hypothetical protein